jgi:hypothetical protein
MSRDLVDLEPEFRGLVEEVLEDCSAHGFELVPYSTLRSAADQAKLWRQGRSRNLIQAEIQRLKDAGARQLARTLDQVGPQFGDKVTNALPGESWHNYGLACDCFVKEDGEAIWDSNHPGYRIYAHFATLRGLTAGFYWEELKDAPHVQARRQLNPVSTLTWAEVERRLFDGGEAEEQQASA